MTGGIETGSLTELVQGQGPFASLSLDTRADYEQAPKEIELRWQAFRRDMAEAGAPEEVLSSIDDVVATAHQEGDGLVVLGRGDGIALKRNLATSIEEAGHWGPVPHLLPLLTWQQENPPYAVALVDRTGAEIEVTSSWRPELSLEVDGDQWPVRRINPGGWSQRRYQKRAENLWEENAKDVAAALEKIAADDDIDLVVLSGDVRAVAFLKDNLPDSFSPTIYEIEGTQAQSVDEISEEINKVVVTHEGQATEALLERFREERGQADQAVEGVGRTARALSEARLHTLILAADADERSAFVVAEDPTQVATDRQALDDLGLGRVVEVPLRDALVRSALAGGSAVRLVPALSADHGPADGVGGILRYTYR
ncbi:MAG: hypothetical protein M3198_08915 [Actinomycetota bacterium]|nr:hypothetical protein [Actinomycetota bacterium]